MSIILSHSEDLLDQNHRNLNCVSMHIFGFCTPKIGIETQFKFLWFWPSKTSLWDSMMGSRRPPPPSSPRRFPTGLPPPPVSSSRPSSHPVFMLKLICIPTFLLGIQISLIWSLSFPSFTLDPLHFVLLWKYGTVRRLLVFIRVLRHWWETL